jgi:uncharacterized SAM-binding protein YcdF (DUF218 family)
MSEFVDLLISPLSFGLLLLAVTLVTWRCQNSRSVRLSVTLALFAYLTVTVPFVSVLLGRGLTPRYPPFAVSERPARVIVLLGGGQINVIGRDEHLAVLSAASTERVLEAARLYRLLDEPWIISSGGGQRRAGPNAVAMRTKLVELGVPVGRILLESTSRTTRDQAVLVAPMLRRLDAERDFVLVTSRIHMPRAAAAFRAVGLEPLPAIAPDFTEREGSSDYLLPTVRGIEFSRAVFHEVVGRLYYRWRGWAR